MKRNPGDTSTADLFVSREGISMLDISPREVKKKGVFGMTMLRSSKDKNEKKK